MKTIHLSLIIFLLSALFVQAQDFALSEGQREEHLSLEGDDLGIQGYDPVSYFEKGPQKGSKKITATVKGVTYRFTSEANKELFLSDPTQYEPAYGGWCAWAMLDGDKTKVDPRTYKIVNGRLFLYYNGFFGNTLDAWNERAAKQGDNMLAAHADMQWAKVVKSE